jgi:hypothetical protein
VAPSWSSTCRHPPRRSPSPYPWSYELVACWARAAAGAHQAVCEDAGIGDGSHLGSAYLLCPGGCRAGCAQPAGSPALRQPSAAGDRLTRPTTVSGKPRPQRQVTKGAPPLAWLPGSDQPTKQAGMATPEPHRALHRILWRSGLPGTVWVRPATRRHNTRHTLRRGVPDGPVSELPSKGPAGGRPTRSSMVRSGRSRCGVAPSWPLRRLTTGAAKGCEFSGA